MARTFDGTTATERSQTSTDPAPDTRCKECSHKWNQTAEGYKCPECGSKGRIIRSERLISAAANQPGSTNSEQSVSDSSFWRSSAY